MYVLELAGEDDAFAAAEAENAAENVAVVAPGLATATAVHPDRFKHLAFSHRASTFYARTDASVSAAKAALESTGIDPTGSAAGIDLTGSVAVRARDVRGTTDVDTQAAEATLGGVLSAKGVPIDLESPDNELVALFSGDTCILGWTVAVSRRGYGERAPTDRPFFQPGSMDPMLARAVNNLARVRSGDRVLDPMCGTGGLLLEAGLLDAGVIGFDAQRSMVAGARANLERYLDVDPLLGVADATALPIQSGAVDAVVFDAPYGRQSKIATHTLETLVSGALSEANRIADRAVLVADRDWGRLAEAAGWSVLARHERRVHRSLVRHVHVLR